jgi:precorrin-6B methylase 2
MEGAAAKVRLEPGSFRDRNGRVFYQDGAILRGLGARAAREWQALSATRFFHEAVNEGKIVRTEQAQRPRLLAAGRANGWALVLEHEAIPFISYPYEWCFSQLKDAALLQIDLLLRGLDEGVILKDASAFNVQWRGVHPTFIDIPSFERWQAGDPWVGYRQFCQMFVNPLLLQAYKDIPFQAWLRGSIDGIAPEQCRNLMSFRDRLRPGVLAHVVLHARAQAAAGGRGDVKQSLRAAGFSADLIQRNARGLRSLIEGLEWKRSTSVWANYAAQNSYADQDRDAKIAFVREVVASRPRRLVWDLGCNTGTFARVAAEHADQVIAMDADHLAVERLYRGLKQEQVSNILPLVVNLADLPPALGWRGKERKDLTQRGRPDLTLCLALLHHMVIGANIPLEEFVDWLSSAVGGDLVIEFVDREDPMVRTLLRNKDDIYDDYSVERFEACLSARYNVVRREALSSGTRTLYHALAHGG